MALSSGKNTDQHVLRLLTAEFADSASATGSNYAVRSSFVTTGGSGCCSIAPALVLLASSAFSSAPTSIANPVQYSHTMSATAAPSVPYVLLKFAKLRK